jgi:hypothetical protein
MGYIKHNAVIVTGWEAKKVHEAHAKANEVFATYFPNKTTIISEIVMGVVNEQYSFFIAPDGSKEGWADSDLGDVFRKDFQDYLQNSRDNYCDYIEICFGGDDECEYVVRSKDKDLNEAE